MQGFDQIEEDKKEREKRPGPAAQASSTAQNSGPLSLLLILSPSSLVSLSGVPLAPHSLASFFYRWAWPRRILNWSPRANLACLLPSLNSWMPPARALSPPFLGSSLLLFLSWQAQSPISSLPVISWCPVVLNLHFTRHELCTWTSTPLTPFFFFFFFSSQLQNSKEKEQNRGSSSSSLSGSFLSPFLLLHVQSIYLHRHHQVIDYKRANEANY